MAPSSTLLELEAFLLAADIGLIPTRLTLSEMPASPDVVTTLYEYPGPGDEPGFGVPGVQFEHPRIQVSCRGVADDYHGPRLQLEKIRQKLATIQAKVLSGTNWQMVVAVGSPLSLGKDSNSRVRLAQNFQVDKSPSRTS